MFICELNWIQHANFPTGLQGKGESISLTPQYHFHSIHRHLDISWAIIAEISPHLYTLQAAEHDPGTFGFRAQVTRRICPYVLKTKSYNQLNNERTIHH